jgi:hypothetical protein
MDALLSIRETNLIDDRTKKRIAVKLKNVIETVLRIESLTGIKYPPYYVEPILTVVASDSGLGVLFARTIPLESEGRVGVVVQLSAPLLLYSTKSSLKIVLAHEFLHYLDLVRKFSKMDLTSQMTSDSIFEETYADAERAIDAKFVFRDKKLVKALSLKASEGVNDPKLIEKCRLQWISKGRPTQRISMGANQTRLSVQSIINSHFDPQVLRFLENEERIGHTQ